MEIFFWIQRIKKMSVPVIGYFIFKIKMFKEDNKSHWRCSKAGCKVTAVTVFFELVSLKGIHYYLNAEKNLENAIKRKYHNKIKTDPSMNVQQIYEQSKNYLEEIYSCSSNFSSLVPSFDSINLIYTE
ncbi:hypothetical protein DMUE_3721 [Dictyocoela muelleri]|nr:hypothetical protein DMUE_3721 [Dictyocoela muelleri]